MTRSAAALVATALVLGCAPVATFDMLVASDRDLFAQCTPSVMAAVCGKDGDDAAKASCLESRSAAYGRLRSPKMRRSWLIANGCPESMIDAQPKPTTAVAVAEPAAPKPTTAVAEVEPAPPPAAPPPAAPPPAAPPPPDPPPTTLPPEPPPSVAALAPREPPPPIATPAPERSPKVRPPTAKVQPPEPPPEVRPPEPLAKVQPREPPPKIQPAAVAAKPAATPEPEPVYATTVTSMPKPAPPKAARPASPPVRAFSGRDRPEAREQRLRDILFAHRTEMKVCVDRQLKLLPNLRAEGTLVIEVDASGSVPRAELLGEDLAGTPLEDCLRTLASRWRFPSSGRAYRIDAPVKVWGSDASR